MYLKHGDHLTKLYALWRNFRHRCKCPTSKDYATYGKRGINVYPEWEDYIKFKKWALSSGYKEGLTIERTNNDLGYNPDNCIFTTIAENNKNRGDTYWWFVKGIKFKSSNDAAKHFKVVRTTISRWCFGYKQKTYTYLPVKNCYAIKKYGG